MAAPDSLASKIGNSGMEFTGPDGSFEDMEGAYRSRSRRSSRSQRPSNKRPSSSDTRSPISNTKSPKSEMKSPQHFTSNPSLHGDDDIISEAGGARRARASVIAGDFIKADGSDVKEEEEDQRTRKEKLQGFALAFSKSYYVGNIMALVVMLDAACTWVDVDARAANTEPPRTFLLISDLSLALYTLEVILVFIGRGSEVLGDWMVLMDIVIVLCGYVEVLLNLVVSADVIAKLSVMRALRLARIFRLMRLFKRIRALRELQKLVTMMATCLRTLAWSFLLCFVIMTIWAMLMVEVVNPLITQMVSVDLFDDCEYCQTATASVMDANLLLFKTVIAGDSWGQVAVPVIQRHPETAIIFVGSLLTLVFGVLNIIVAVVVDTFAEARENDIMNLAEEMEEDIEKDREALGKLFSRIDKDQSGQLTLPELIQGARRDAIFQSRLRVMDIDENDLEQLFSMIDVDRSGTIEISEFIGPLSRWVHDSKTAPRFIKYNMLQTMQLQEDLYNLSKHYFTHLSDRIDLLSAGLNLATGGMSKQSSLRPSQYSQQGSPGLPGFGNFSTSRPHEEEIGICESWIEQPHCSIKPVVQLSSAPALLEPPGVKHDRPDRYKPPTPGTPGEECSTNLQQLSLLLEAAVLRVEGSMIEMESRIKRTFAGLPPDGSMPQFDSKIPNPTGSQEVNKVSVGRMDLFKSVYGEGRRRRSGRKMTTSFPTSTYVEGAVLRSRRQADDAALAYVPT